MGLAATESACRSPSTPLVSSTCAVRKESPPDCAGRADASSTGSTNNATLATTGGDDRDMTDLLEMAGPSHARRSTVKGKNGIRPGAACLVETQILGESRRQCGRVVLREGAGEDARAPRARERGRDLDMALAGQVQHGELDRPGGRRFRHRVAQEAAEPPVEPRTGERQEHRLRDTKPYVEAQGLEDRQLDLQGPGERAM